MALIWSIPVVAAAVATFVVVGWARSLEDEASALARELARLAEIRRPLSAVRAAAAETDDLVSGFRAAHRGEAPPASD